MCEDFVVRCNGGCPCEGFRFWMVSYLYISRSMVSKTIDRQAHGTRVSYYKSFLECLRANLGAVLFWHTSRLPSKVRKRLLESTTPVSLESVWFDGQTKLPIPGPTNTKSPGNQKIGSRERDLGWGRSLT